MENGYLQQYSRHVYYDANEREYVALCSEFPHISAFGETAEEALADLDVALEGAIEVHRDEGWPLPEPLAPPKPHGLPSGKFVVRLPRTLHARLVRRAQDDGVSLNSVVIALLAEGEAAHAFSDRLESLKGAIESITMLPRPGVDPSSHTTAAFFGSVHEELGLWRDMDGPDVESTWSETSPGARPLGSFDAAQEVRLN